MNSEPSSKAEQAEHTQDTSSSSSEPDDLVRLSKISEEKEESEKNRRKLNYRIDQRNLIIGWLASIITMIVSGLILVFAGYIVVCRPGILHMMGEWAAAALVGGSILSFVFAYGNIIKGAFKTSSLNNPDAEEDIWIVKKVIDHMKNTAEK